MKQSLKTEILLKFDRTPESSQFLRGLMRDATVYVFGGVVRNFLDKNLNKARDIDLVLCSHNRRKINIPSYLGSKVVYRKNRYDGYKIIFSEDFIVDVWNLQDTWAFKYKKTKLLPTVINLMKTVYLNIDALVYSLNRGVFLGGCDKHYRTNIHSLDIIFPQNPYENLNLMRALIFHQEYSYAFSQVLINRFKNYIKGKGTMERAVQDLANVQLSHYHKLIIPEKELFILIKRIYKENKI